MTEFTKLGLKKDILEVLAKLKYKKAFEVQEKVVPLALKGANVVFTSRTGSGKTLAYLLGHLSKINKKLNTQMLVVVPTRELCIQVGKELEKICDPLNINVGTLYGGREVAGDYRTLNKKNHIVVATPGRLIVHVNDKKLKVGDVRYLVYDESDQMFDEGFYDDCVYIKQRVSKDAQIIFASATMTEKVKEFMVEEIIHYDLLRIGELIPTDIIQQKIECDMDDKNEVLLRILSRKKFKKVLIFCNTKDKSYRINIFLEENNLDSNFLNSDLDQEDRQNHLNQFKDKPSSILVSTDVAARGLQIDKVDLVINYDVPTNESFYIHRIGRTGRAGKKGQSITLVCPEDEDRFYNIEFEYELSVSQVDENLIPLD